MTHPEGRFPRAGEASLADVVPSLLAALDVPGFANPLGVEPARRVCLLVVDGLGFVQLDANREQVPFLTTGATSVQPIAAGFPATTVASLGSLGTGRHPGEHGLVGMTMALPGQQRAMNLLRWAAYGPGPATDLRDRVAPEWFQPEPTTFERAAADRVSDHLVGPRDHARSGLTRAVLRGGRYESVHSLGELAAMTLRHLAGAPRTLVYAYHRDLDLTGHARGVGSDNWRLHLGFVDRLVEQIAERMPGDALLAVVADDGMVDLQPQQKLDLADRRSWPTGCGCWPARPERGTSMSRTAPPRTCWRPGGRSSVSRCGSPPVRRAIEQGWFGPRVLDRVRPRIGDVVAAAREPVGIFQRDVDPGQALLVGLGGALQVGMEQRPARGHQVVGVHRHPVGRRVMPCDRPKPDHLRGHVVGHQLRSQLPQPQRVQLGRVHRHRGVLGVGEQVGEQDRPAAPHPSLRPDRRGQPGGRPLDPLGTERAARLRLLRHPGERLRVGRRPQSAAGRSDQPGGVPGERVPAHLHAGRHGLEASPRMQDLPSQDLTAQLHRTSTVSAADQDQRHEPLGPGHRAVNPVASTFQRLLADLPAGRFADYLATERRLGARHLGGRGRVEWLAAFAPVGPAELRAFVPGVSAPAELDEPLVAELGWGIAIALGLYAELGFESFSLALYGLPRGHPLTLRMVCRQNPRPFYRSGVMYLERLHLEAAVDVVPEQLAERAGDRFRG